MKSKMTKNKKKHKAQKSRNSIMGYFFIGVIAFLLAICSYLLFISSSTNFKEDQHVILIYGKQTNSDNISHELSSKLTGTHFFIFKVLANTTGYWNEIKPGRYIIKKESSVFSVFRKLLHGKQDPVRITINKFRTKSDFATFLGKKLEHDKTQFLQFFSSNDSLSTFELTSEDFLSTIIPNTYEIYWNISPRAFVKRMQHESDKFWNTERTNKLAEIGFTKKEVMVIASIVEEETNNVAEKPTIASVYVNRLKLGMPLGADPTIKFAVGDFTIKRVLFSHINSTASSPYNTYKNKGLPPGPICTPSIASIDAVLKGQKTEYLYFCAKADFSGTHSFARNAEEHLINANNYRKALDSLGIR